MGTAENSSGVSRKPPRRRGPSRCGNERSRFPVSLIFNRLQWSEKAVHPSTASGVTVYDTLQLRRRAGAYSSWQPPLPGRNCSWSSRFMNWYALARSKVSVGDRECPTLLDRIADYIGCGRASAHKSLAK